METARNAARWIAYWTLGRLFNRPRTLVTLARIAQHVGVAIACSADEVNAVLRRTGDFSRRAHAGNLVAGEFVIGLDSGPYERIERAAASCPLPTPVDFGDLAAREAQKRVVLLRRRLDAGESVDVVNDYMTFVAWRALGGIFGRASARAVEGMVPNGDRDTALRTLFFELRHVGAHLIVGGIAPRRVQLRAHACAAALNSRVARAIETIRAEWSTCASAAVETAHRQAVGLMWVGHAAMVQSGAFVFQQLHARPDHYRVLRERAQALGDAACTDPGFRALMLCHVLECLRLQPPFPLLSRLLPRGADLGLCRGGRPKTIRAGSRAWIGIASALRDPARFEDPDEYRPTRMDKSWPAEADLLPIFGIGARACVAREQVVELLVSAAIGLVSLPALDHADGLWRRVLYDGPIVTRMRVRTRS